MSALAPENKPAPRGPHDVKLICEWDRFGRLGEPEARQDAASGLWCDARRLRRVSCREKRLSVSDRRLGKLAVPRVVQQTLAEDVPAIFQERAAEARFIDAVVRAAVGISGHTVTR